MARRITHTCSAAVTNAPAESAAAGRNRPRIGNHRMLAVRVVRVELEPVQLALRAERARQSAVTSAASRTDTRNSPSASGIVFDAS
jgi:hypothetical protein